MSIEFYSWNTPNGRKISVALEEMGLPYEVKAVDLAHGHQTRPDFLKISPNGRIPAIIDLDGPSGRPISVFESGAILLYLAEKTGQFLPRSLEEKVPVLEWLMWQMGGFGPMPGQVHHFLGVTDEVDQRYGLARYTAETNRLYHVLNTRLAKHAFVADTVSIADFAIVGWVWRHPKHRVDLAQYPHVSRWYETMMNRPATRRGFEVVIE